jgi:signal transduction histidine kinase/iron only hydrogenase large subunit-like protein
MGGIVTTIGEKCKRCYTCVRHCPAKAIMVQEGRAKVLPERCVACGNCIRVCSQKAKRLQTDDLVVTRGMIGAGEQVVACFAPSFPAVFPEVRPRQLVQAARRLGFARVMEVAMGAELVAHAYRKLLQENGDRGPMITTPCPALVGYVEKHLPGLLPYLAPIVSPMVALGRLIKRRLMPGAKVVFIGPCLAKKIEAKDENLEGEVDAVLTFQEFREWLEEERVEVGSLPEREFDGPHPAIGRIFPVSGGLLRTSAMEADVLDDDIVVTEGVDRITDLLRQMDNDHQVGAKFFDLLFCEGCISGPFIGDRGNTVTLKQRVASYTREEMERGEVAGIGMPALQQYLDLDLSRGFSDSRVKAAEPTEEEIQAILRQTDKLKPEDELNCGACGYVSCREKAIAVYNGLAEAEMCLPYLIEKLQRTIVELNDSRRNLLEAEEQLMHSEKLASMGQLAAGVAHEINNPLGTVLIYSHMLLKEMELEDPRREDLQMITREAERCRHIVRGLLDFSRQSKLRDELMDVNELLRGTVDLLEKQGDFAQIELTTELQEDLPRTRLDPEQMRQAFINILENAVEAMPERGRLRVSTRLVGDGKSISVAFADTGMGIPEENLERIFHPFFTTKQIGRGTGLGLAILYGIVKMHRGAISVDSKVGVGTTFAISLPVVESREMGGGF